MTLNLLLQGPLIWLYFIVWIWLIVKLCVQSTFLYQNKSLCQSHELFFVVFPGVPEHGKVPLLHRYIDLQNYAKIKNVWIITDLQKYVLTMILSLAVCTDLQKYVLTMILSLAVCTSTTSVAWELWLPLLTIIFWQVIQNFWTSSCVFWSFLTS